MKMKSNVTLISMLFTASTSSWATSDSNSDKVAQIFQSEEFRENLIELQHEGYALLKLDDLMDRSKSEIEARATQNVHVSVAIHAGDPILHTELRSPVAFFDADGNAHVQELRIVRVGRQKWTWHVGTQWGTLNSFGKTRFQTSAATFDFEVTQRKWGPSEILKVTQDGYTKGRLVGWTDGPDSNHRQAIYSNGESQIIEFRKQ